METKDKETRWFPDIGKRPWRNIDIMVAAVAGLLDNFAILLSLGYWDNTNLEMGYLVWRTKKQCEARKQQLTPGGLFNCCPEREEI